jgi:4-deoxy-L-threo-5-hexosulose-uronate ketol-isomerase
MVSMKVRYPAGPDQVRRFTTTDLRQQFLVEDLFQPGQVSAVYTHHDRVVIAGALPDPAIPLPLPTFDPLRSDFFLQRREAGVINVGPPGVVDVDGQSFPVGHGECVYIGRGARDVVFHHPGAYYLVSAPAHEAYPTRHATLADANITRLGDSEGSNDRTIHRYIHLDGIRSCQLVMGVTVLEPGSMWNTMPCHTHDRRTEIYLYFDLDPDHRVVHLMGKPDETRNLIVADRQAVISPSWSVHCGFGTRRYAFVWAMAGENQAFDDMDHVAITEML